MSFEADEEILQDFLVEAGEILELLSEQLVELESSPDDMNLLNAIFRGFHTVKGGAGFLQLTELVECCHIAENVFDILRKGERKVTPELMDVVLQALDSVISMFNEVREGVQLTPAPRELLADLACLAEPESATQDNAEVAAPEQEYEEDDADAEFQQMLEAAGSEPSTTSQGDAEIITDEEFEALLDELQGPATAKAPASSDEITDDEFENLLDQLHGSGKFQLEAPANTKSEQEQAVAPTMGSSENISDDEFENLLDQLHGKGKFDVSVQEPAPAAVKPQPVEQPAPVKAVSPAKEPANKAPVAQRAAAAEETTVRVDTARLDDIMNMVGELVLVRNRLVRLGIESGDEDMGKAVANLDVVTGDLQTAVMKTRMQPIKKVFGRFPRLVRDMARSLKKDIKLELIGEETDLDKNLVEALADPLVHLVRNSVDHGIEMPDEREAAGKAREGKVVLSAAQEGDHILLMITDDGKGMDADILRAKAVEKGMYDKDAADRLTEFECYNLIFAPGFSTKTEISDVSGRGVGMDVVNTKINQLNGSVNVYSKLGEGSQVVIKVPLTLAIMPTLMVMLKDQAFAFPLVNVNEIFHLDLSRTNVVDGQEVVIVRDKALPLFYLKRWLLPQLAHEEQSEGHVVIVTVGDKRVGFVVDQLVGQEEVVIKPLSKMLQGTPGMSGATITGDGRIALILDVPSLLKHYV
ncbi:MAG: chemotaxis protein CheA [Thiopseudomonas sp.]|nr:chemotaxis protein CheA [Thiopseudomonas sp.]MCK9464824.1 chemotaxis protein CheA [Thiopseudomonas sp.]